ncbi:DNA-binding protein Bv3F [Polaromonas vacuolata]|uniref:DNA-binding protein Bv3F n=1 Tax=Polaromonas vacuolata TaxID=37448 RepID=A0A6H2HDZ8_9BURK|nr:H-NS histone family protein [Polaromonas vacuolata]QJC57804.1 DNA-binding protein Bv3F [Polaromonas vacuolata]
MSTLVDLQSQIEKLQKQASLIKAKEFDKTVREIREKMYAFGITVKDLQTTKVSKPAKVEKDPTDKPAKVRKTLTKKGNTQPVAAKYQGPDGQTWSGRGLTPRWLAALIEQGRGKPEFLITADES